MQQDDLFQIIDCQRIAFNDTFISQLTEGRVDTILIDNLHRFGQMNPLLVRQIRGGQYQLLADYQTFLAIAAAGIQRITCRVLQLNTPPFFRYTMQALHGLNTPHASPILQAYLLQQACHDLEDDDLLSLLSLMGHKPNRYIYDELTALLALSPVVVLAMHQGILAPKTGKLLRLLTHEDQSTLARLVRFFRPGGSKQYKLVEMLVELSLRSGQPMEEIVREWVVEDHEQTRENAPQRFQGLLRHLSEIYSPEKTQMAQRFRRFVDTLHLPKDVTVTPSPSFEDESVEVCLRFANSEYFLQKWEKIRSVLQE
jgi:ParB family transcriptional regulator, chromosome partitioning protein